MVAEDVVAEDRSGPKLAVVVVKDPVRVEVSVGVVWEVLVVVGAATVADALVMLDVEVACNAITIELATEGE